MKVKVIVFDLDDTLYEEIDYVYSGFKNVSKYFCEKYEIEEKLFYSDMLDILENDGRGQVFNKVLKKYNIFSNKSLKKSISLYRLHTPKISLPTKSIEILNYYKELGVPLYLVTDGNKVVQANKIEALGLKKFMKFMYITHRYGQNNAKPSTYCFEKIAKTEKVKYSDIVYIGDNINKDFINIKKLGYRTIRIFQGMFKHDIKDQEYHAEETLDDLVDIKKIIEI